MIQKTPVSAIACAPGALAGGPVRTRFFDGMFLTQADLENEQRYWRLKRRLTNRALGEGVVWGLKLAWDQPRHQFSLSAGYALDCCGNDLIVECPLEISEAELWSRADPALKNRFGKVPPIVVGRDTALADAKTRHACVVLQYTECAEDMRPVHRDACAGATSVCEPSRIRETARLLLVPPPAPRKTPPEKFLEDLITFRDSLPADIKNALFPPQGTPPVTPDTGLVPMTVNVTVPGSPAATVAIQPLATGSTAPQSLQATQTPDTKRRTGVVSFELKPSLGWGFTSGNVFDQARLVESVTPPVAPSMFWSLDLALPDHDNTADATFEFQVDKLAIAEIFGGTRQGLVDLRIRGVLRVQGEGDQVIVSVERLVVLTERADVTERANDQGCLRELVPWGWTVDPANGRKLASVLMLSSAYAFLSEVVRRGGSQAWQTIATLIYTLTWYALFGVFPLAGAPATEEHRKKLAALILALYKRWCDGLAYPGPRCADEHHGIYLGCVELDASNRIVSFDMWEGRRYVVTGATLGYWAQQFGIAPLDVIVGRFARALCCLAGLPPLAPSFQTREPVIGREVMGDRFHVGTSGTVTDFAKSHGGEPVWVTNAELARRTPEALLRRDEDGPVQVIATQIEGGGSIAIAVPGKRGQIGTGKIRDDVRGMVRRGPQRVRERGREAIADFTVAVLREAAPTAVLSGEVPPATETVAKRLTDSGATVADVLEGGAEGVLARIGDRSPEVVGGADDLVDRSELALDSVVIATVESLGPALDRSTFAIPERQKTLATAIEKAIPKLDRRAVIAAATAVARA